jgi:atypical dual specificity phosphatase
MLVSHSTTGGNLPVAQPIFRAQSTISRIAKSTLVWTTVVAVPVLSSAIRILTSKAPFSYLIAIATVSVLLFIRSRARVLLHEASLAFTLARRDYFKQNWWDKVYDGLHGSAIFLGGIPLENRGHKEEILKEGVTAVLSIVESFEIQTNGFASEPVKKWGNGVERMIFESPDFAPVSQEIINKAVDQLHTWLGQGKKVYVHCKAGKARSATIIICYFLKYQRMGSVFEAENHLLSKRPQLHFNSAQRKAIETFRINFLKSIQSRDQS